MNVVAAAVGAVVPKLLELLGDEYKLQRGVKKEVENLSTELKYVHSFLLKVSEVPWDQLDEQVKVWASDIREASYDMEDILDTFLVLVEGREPTGRSRMKRAMNKMTDIFRKGKARHDVGCAIQDIMKQLRDVATQRDRYRINDLLVNSSATASSVDPRLKAMYKEVESLVGVEEPSKDLISKLISPRQGNDDIAQPKKIVSIFGTGGLGKTTLAKVVYDKLRPDFQCGAFVPVGRNPNLVKLLADILYELDKSKHADIDAKNRDERQLIDSLREFLVDKRYFIVIDDIWETESWKETIKLALLENNLGSRIIITTRNSQVATEIGDEVYRMQPLTNGNSKKLFYTRIFGPKEKWPDYEPDEIPEQILKKCDGIPLAIITMASLLVGKPRERWSDVFASVGFGHKEDKEVDNTTKILSYSYYDMSAHLRTCLLYLSVFPEDYEIAKESLIWKWIAEGFIQGKQGIRLFEVGEQYFNDLVNRSMIQPVEFRYKGVVTHCRVHDMVLDLIRSISSEENFITILDNVETPPSSARRLALHDSTARGSMVDMTRVRSLVVAISSDIGNWIPLSSFKLLRVLDMEGCKSLRPTHLVCLEHSLHLRYLGLKDTPIDDLPNEIGSVKLLQTLNCERTGIMQLPPSMSQLTQLVCLKCNLNHMFVTPLWIGKLMSLEELQVPLCFSNKDDGNKGKDQGRVFLKELGNLKQLRVFRTLVPKMDYCMQRDLVLSLGNLRKLEHLEVRCFGMIDADTSMWGEASGLVLPRHLRALYLDVLFRISCLPSCISVACLPNLTHLSLHVKAMDHKDLEFLGRLPELYFLRLNTMSTVSVSNISASNNGYFQKLRFCNMSGSMIQFRCKEGDSGVSFHIWNGVDALPFGFGRNECNVAPCNAMPNLEMLHSRIFVRALKNGRGDCGDMGLECLPSLQTFAVYISCEGASATEVDEVEATLAKAVEVHPNHPTIEVYRYAARQMISAVHYRKPEDDVLLTKQDGQTQQQEGEPMTAEGVTKSSIVDS